MFKRQLNIALLSASLGAFALLTFVSVAEARWKDLNDYFPGLTEKDMEIAGNEARVILKGKPVGTIVSWENPESGNAGTVQLISEFKWEGHNCRKVLHKLDLAKKANQNWEVSVCNIDGEWKWPTAPKRLK